MLFILLIKKLKLLLLKQAMQVPTYFIMFRNALFLCSINLKNCNWELTQIDLIVLVYKMKYDYLSFLRTLVIIFWEFFIEPA